MLLVKSELRNLSKYKAFGPSNLPLLPVLYYSPNITLISYSLQFALQFFDFRPDSLVFSRFSLQKTNSQLGLLRQSMGGEDIGVAQFVWVIFEVIDLYPTLVYQGLQAVVDLAHADTQLPCQLALANFGVRF